MDVHLEYGDYVHPSGEVVVVITRRTIRGEDDVATEEVINWQIAGRLEAANQAALTTALQELEAGYAEDGGDIGLYLSDGTPTAHVILSAQTSGGVMVTNRPEYPIGEGAQYANYRDFRIGIEAKIPINFVPGGSSTIISQETLDITGDGGPAFVIREQLVGKPIPYQTKQFTKTSATQSGYAEGYGRYPFTAAPIFPQWLKRDVSRVKYMPPGRTMSGPSSKQRFRIEWTYVFESPGPENGSSF